MTKVKAALLGISAAGAALVATGWAMPGQALTVIGNDTFTSFAANPPAQTTGIDNLQNKAVSFTTDSRTWTLNSLRLSLSGYESGDSPLIQIRSNSAGIPGAAVATLTGSAPATSSFATYTFTPTTAFNFNPSTTYWLVVAATTSSQYQWLTLTNNTTPTSTQNWTFGSYLFSPNGGTSWSASTEQNSFQIDATDAAAVPFPFSPLPGLLISGGMWGLKRLKKGKVESSAHLAEA